MKHSLDFHDCASEVNVPLNAWTDNLLLEDVWVDDLTTETEFDSWMSAEFSLKGGDYNAL